LCKMECTSNHELVANIKYANGRSAIDTIVYSGDEQYLRVRVHLSNEDTQRAQSSDQS